MMARPQAVLWDVDGTLAETERDGHRVAFNLAFEACGVPWRWDEEHYGELLRITGGRERLLHDMTMRKDAPPLAAERQALARVIHDRKNVFYASLINEGHIALRGGVRELIEECLQRGVRMALTTTTSRSNVKALLCAHLGPHWQDSFAAVVCGEDVSAKKPDPEVYFQALRRLAVSPNDAVAIEDSPGGVAAARLAEVPVVVTLSAYFANATIEGAIAIGPGLHDRRGWRPALRASASAAERVGLDDIQAWCAQMETVSQFG
jgi:HAD superfamily hydrolase (TIGR01509 family)